MMKVVCFMTACIALMNMASSWAQQPQPGAKTRGETFVLSIGIDLYRDKRSFPPLRLAQRDALDVADRFRSAGAICRALTIGNDPKIKSSDLPTSAKVVNDAVVKMARESGPEDTLIFYFAGHGMTGADGVSYLCVHDTDAEKLKETAVSISGLFSEFDPARCRARSVLFLIDACRTGEGVRGGTPRSFNLSGANALKTIGGRCCIQSTENEAEEPPVNADHSGGTSENIKNAYFTHCLLRTLEPPSASDQDAIVTLEDLINSVKERMRKINFERGTSQTPVVFRDPGVDFVVFDSRKVSHPPEIRKREDASVASNTVLINEPKHGAAIQSSAKIQITGTATSVSGAVLEVNGIQVPIRDARWAIETSLDSTGGAISAVLKLPNGETFEHRIRVVLPGAKPSHVLPRTLTWAEVPPGTTFVDGLPSRVIHRKTKIEMVLVPAGEFLMGSIMDRNVTGHDPAAEGSETPRHRVKLTKPFYLGQYEVTVDTIDGNGVKLPKTKMPWPKVSKWCRENDLRLPTEAEWEYAARAGSNSPYPWGTEFDLDTQYQYANCNHPDAAVQEVGKRLPNKFGFFDMLGNVAEWVADEWSNDYGDSSPKVDPAGVKSGETSPNRIVRGGSVITSPQRCRPALREYTPPQSEEAVIGFRAARDID